MDTSIVDEIYNQAQQLSPTDKRQLSERLLQDLAPEPPATFHTEEELQQMLQAGLDSGPATPMTQLDWEDIRQEVRARAAHRNAEHSLCPGTEVPV